MKPPVYANPYDSVPTEGPLTLHRFGLPDAEVAKRIPNLSPFPLKLEAYLRMNGIPYATKLERGPRNAPRGKVPFVSIGDTKLTDSQLAIDFLKGRHADPDSALTDAQRTTGLLVQRALEDHLYWCVLYYEFYDDAGAAFFSRTAFGPPSPPLEAVREDFIARLHSQGVARYTADEVLSGACADLAALDSLLRSTWLLGTDGPTSYDAIVFGMTVAIFQVPELHPALTAYARGLSHLAGHVRRVLTSYFPELTIAF